MDCVFLMKRKIQCIAACCAAASRCRVKALDRLTCSDLHRPSTGGLIRLSPIGGITAQHRAHDIAAEPALLQKPRLPRTFGCVLRQMGKFARPHRLRPGALVVTDGAQGRGRDLCVQAMHGKLLSDPRDAVTRAATVDQRLRKTLGAQQVQPLQFVEQAVDGRGVGVMARQFALQLDAAVLALRQIAQRAGTQ